ncbi:MAG: hypothetical protein IPP47_26415 [Bryobacterales bacterium]|nr:hypothetical protein [Bryobacterales bacterium]
MTIPVRWQWAAVAALTLLAFGLRTAPQWESVFPGSFVNFQESDAWFHVRVVENLVHHFPSRIAVDPYLGVGPVQGVATGPFYDWVLGGVVWAAGLGRPSEALIHQTAAWYPAVLGALIVPVVFVLGQMLFGVWAGLVAAAVIATLPGHFFLVSSLGFTDHHVMESLLSALFVLALLRALEHPASWRRTALAGLALAAYLLTFVGGAFFVAIIVAWASYHRMRAIWPQAAPPLAVWPVCGSLLLAAVLVAPWYRLLWMPFSLAALVGGAALILALSWWGAYCAKGTRPPLVFFAGLAAAAVGGGALALALIPGLRSALGSVAPFFFPQYFGTTGAVRELQSLVLAPGGFTLLPAWRQFAGAYVLSIVGLFLLGEAAVRRPERGPALLFFWGFATFLLAMGQVRMTYYFALAAALLSGYVVARIVESDTRAAMRWGVGAALLAGVLAPNVASAVETGQQMRGVSPDWRLALEWLRQSTPEPFGDPAFYYARYGRDFVAPPGAYNVMAWWDYGYWLAAIARRPPATNPTQAYAAEAARFFLAQTEDEAVAELAKTRARYAVINAELLLLQDQDGVARGNFTSFFAWDRTRKAEDYFLIALEPTGDGRLRTKLLYRPAYYRSMAARLFVYGTAGVAAPEGVKVAYFEQKTTPEGKPYRTLAELRRFDSFDAAVAAERECKAAGCELVGDNPQLSCVPLAPVQRLRSVFHSDSIILGLGRSARHAVQIYELPPAVQGW